MTDEERIDDAYERIDIDTDEILAFYDGERVERCLKSIWDSTVTMHQIATVALKENAKLRESVRNLLTCVKHEECEESCPNYEPMYTDYGYEKNGSTVVEEEYLGCCLVGLENCDSMLFDTDEYLRELGIEVAE